MDTRSHTNSYAREHTHTGAAVGAGGVQTVQDEDLTCTLI